MATVLHIDGPGYWRELLKHIEWSLRKEEFAGPSRQEKWEAFYLLTPPPTILDDPEAYWRIRRRLLAEGKSWVSH